MPDRVRHDGRGLDAGSVIPDVIRDRHDDDWIKSDMPGGGNMTGGARMTERIKKNMLGRGYRTAMIEEDGFGGAVKNRYVRELAIASV